MDNARIKAQLDNWSDWDAKLREEIKARDKEWIRSIGELVTMAFDNKKEEEIKKLKNENLKLQLKLLEMLAREWDRKHYWGLIHLLVQVNKRG